MKLFDNYVNKRAVELYNENKYLYDTEGFKKFVYFQEDLKETLSKVHRQANEHKESDFADSELILQDFIRRYSDESRPETNMFDENGNPKLLN